MNQLSPGVVHLTDFDHGSRPYVGPWSVPAISAVPDPKRPLGAKECGKCSGVCNGHYLGTEDLLAMENCNLRKAHTSPPSTVIKDAFDKKQKQGLEMTPDEIEQLAKQT